MRSKHPAIQGLLIEHRRTSDEGIVVDLTEAFHKVGTNLLESEKPLQTQIEMDALQSLFNQSKSPMLIATELYGFPVEIADDYVRIYRKKA